MCLAISLLPNKYMCMCSEIGNYFKTGHQYPKQENIFIQLAHNLFDGKEYRYCMNGYTVTNGMTDTFRRYSAHLSGLVSLAT